MFIPSHTGVHGGQRRMFFGDNFISSFDAGKVKWHNTGYSGSLHKCSYRRIPAYTADNVQCFLVTDVYAEWRITSVATRSSRLEFQGGDKSVKSGGAVGRGNRLRDLGEGVGDQHIPAGTRDNVLTRTRGLAVAENARLMVCHASKDPSHESAELISMEHGI
ncbi:hypothetical protein BC829DRAFT_422612 [Chytridium lagenaria]|nr:hypothetical protein BC829DRAFT_422612 [Chytridium lagenaria]